MTYFPDLSLYTYHSTGEGENTLNVGWLDITQPFQKGEVPTDFIDRLWEFCRTRIVVMRGFHQGQFCENSSDGIPTIQYKDEVFKAGYSELRVFGKENIIYAAPNLIFHYIIGHRYCPPQEFIDAVLSSPFPETQEYKEKATQYFWGKRLCEA